MFKTLHNAWRAVTVNRRTFHALNALDDRTLTDIGLRRADLPAVANKTKRPFAEHG